VEDGDLDVMGTWPEFATKILEACRQKQEEEGNDVDIMFDVAVRLGQNIAGFQYGRSLPDNREDRCVYLKSTKSTQPILAKAKGEVRGPVIDVDLEDEEEKKPSLIWRLLGLLAVIGLVILVIYETQRRGEFPSRFVASLFRALM
jgi:hypothetical protein